MAAQIAVRMKAVPSSQATIVPSATPAHSPGPGALSAGTSDAGAPPAKPGNGANPATNLAPAPIVAGGVNLPATATLPTGAPPPASPAPVATSSAPTSQLAAALVGVGPIPGGDHGEGSGQGTRLTIALAPPAIGTVTLQIDRNADGSSAVAIGASHAATLDQLQNDRAALEQMLTQAGVPVDHRAVTFHLVAAHAETALSLQAGGNGGTAGFGFSFGAGGQGGSQPRSAGGASVSAQLANPPTDSPDGAAVPSLETPLPAPSGLRRFGVNVMV